MELQQAIQESQMAIDYFFNNRFEQARALMKPELSIYHSVGHSVFLFLEAMLTFVRILIKLSLSPILSNILRVYNLHSYIHIRNTVTSKLHRILSNNAFNSAINFVANQRSLKVLEKHSKNQTTKVILILKRTLSCVQQRRFCSRRC